MKRLPSSHAVTLVEVVIAMAGSILIIGVLAMGAISLQKSFSASEGFASSQADQRRLVDYVARDLRRAVGIATAAPGGTATRLTRGDFTLDEDGSLIVTLPAYYRSNLRNAADYDEALTLIASGDRVAYGTEAGPTPAFPVTFRKVFLAAESTMCFVREEGDTRQVIVRGAADLQLQITMAADGASCSLVSQYASGYSRARRPVEVHDEVMLRNTRID